MKFVHIADLHFDKPFINLSDSDTLGDLQRLEQRKTFKKVINYIKENDIDFLLIAGDLYEHQYIKQSTIEFLNQQFSEIPKTQIFISPGNHDPNLKKSYYQTYQWSDNVTIFNSYIEKKETEKANIYGFGFDDFYCTDCGIENFEIEESEKPNILIIHGSLDGANLQEKQYNSITTKTLEEKNFDYVALGHIHKNNFEEGKKIVYPGSLMSLGFDELGTHGMVVGEIDENKELKTKFVEIESNQFIEKEIDVTEILSKEELIEKIQEVEIKQNEFVKIILVGKRNFEIDVYELYKLIAEPRIIKIRNHTKINFNLEEIANDRTLRGLFAKEMKARLEKDITEEEKEIIEKAVEVGLEALK